MKNRIEKLLVANRGEIAVRIIRTCKELGIRTVALYSEVDFGAPHTRLADEAYALGPAEARESYLDVSKILDIANLAEVDAIHPGYGFLSENADFAQAVGSLGIRFIGPSPDAIRTMGDKTTARQLAAKLGVPIVPGTTKPVESVTEAIEVAARIGYPVLLKAAAGGGGKGMRSVNTAEELQSLFPTVRSEVRASFGDDRVYIEKQILSPAHIEVQILADAHGTIVHLGERECSVQRRHQKIIEESPSTKVNTSLRTELVEASRAMVHASGYTNAGTLEFLVDTSEKDTFYFLEMNTRLQVEHPITEMRTGIDLVREQIRISEGEPISFLQESIEFRGHALECRLYAEDSRNQFFPSTGRIDWCQMPAGPNVRVDSGIEAGRDITPYYDPLLAKISVWGANRDQSINRMSAALKELELFGVTHNADICLWTLNHPDFRSGTYTTRFLAQQFSPDRLPPAREEEIVAASIITSYTQNNRIRRDANSDEFRQANVAWKSKRRDSYS
jgi:acetyl-CoA carboxylase biotin carboxylase subunit